MLQELVRKCRSCRRFFQQERIPQEVLQDLADTARLTGSAANRQALKFKLVSDEAGCAAIFPQLSWAAALKNWDGPREGERPSAYIIILSDLRIGKATQWDEGIAAQTIMLAATEAGYGGCMIASCNRGEILKVLGLDPADYAVGLVLALGRPKEKVCLVPVGADGSTAYYRDEAGVHYVPKRSLKDVLL